MTVDAGRKFLNQFLPVLYESFFTSKNGKKKKIVWYSRRQESTVESSELPVVLPGGQVGAHGVLALLPQDLLYELRLGYMNCQDGAKARLPHGAVLMESFHLGQKTKD